MGSVIEVENLHKRYGSTVAVDDVSFTVAPGEIFGILGRNGAGKTTTVECLMPEAERLCDRIALIDAGRVLVREAAARLFITEATVKTHLLNIYAKLDVNDRAAAVAEGYNRGLLAAPERP